MEYSSVFSNRCSSYIKAMNKYPNAMKEEFEIAVKNMDLDKNKSNRNTIVSIPAGCVELQNFLPEKTNYLPFEIDPTFSKLVNQPLCSLNTIPVDTCSVDRIISLAALHHASSDERKEFYIESNRILKFDGKLIIADVELNSKEDIWLNTFVNKYNPIGHKGKFWDNKDIELFNECGFDVKVESFEYSWNFENRSEMIDFCRILFFLENIDDKTIDTSLTQILNATNTKIPWKLLYFTATKKKFNKPENWASMKLYEKIQTYKNYINYNITPFIDKLVVKDYVIKATNGECNVCPVIRILDTCQDILQKDLVPGNIIKSTHGCGWNIFISEKTKLDIVKKELLEWNKPYIGNYEKFYSLIKPRFFIEKNISDFLYGNSNKAITFMFRCIHGKPISINVRDFTKGSLQNNYNLDGTFIKKSFEFELPKEVSKMIELAKILSKPFEFVRVDFYLSDTRDIYFSEFTFTPSGGLPFYTNNLEIKFGKLWT